jgi:heterodisulfide reductase subunit C
MTITVRRDQHYVRMDSTQDGTEHLATCYTCGWAGSVCPTRDDAFESRQRHLNGIE